MDTFTVVIRDKSFIEALARMAAAEIREPEQQLNWEVEKLLLRHAKPADTAGEGTGTVRHRRPRSAAA